MARERILVVSPRPPRGDGQGDQRRAAGLIEALGEHWRVDVLSWLPDTDTGGARRWIVSPLALAHAAPRLLRVPASVAYVQARAPRDLAAIVAGYDLAVLVTDRAVPPALVPPNAVVDFIDDLGGAALRRASVAGLLSAPLWRWQARQLRRFDRRLAAAVRASVAHSAVDAAAIAPQVGTVPLVMGTAPMPEQGRKVVFFGNLFYAPNHEAAVWICRRLVPALEREGVAPGDVTIAGRRPRRKLRAAAAAAGVDLRADLPDLWTVLAEAAVAVAPMNLGVGAINKVVDAVGAGRPCVLSPLANEGLGLIDGRSALVCPRRPADFAAAVSRLLGDERLRWRMSEEARRQLRDCTPEAVAAAWRSLVSDALVARPRYAERPGAPASSPATRSTSTTAPVSDLRFGPKRRRGT